MRLLLLALLALLWAGESLYGQATHSDSVQLRNACRLAVQVLTTGEPAPHHEWAQNQIGACGTEQQSRSLVVLLTRHRTLADTAALRRLWQPTTWLRDRALFERVMVIASDPSASAGARVYALRALQLIRHPNRVVRFHHLVGGFVDNPPFQLVRGGCSRGDVSHPHILVAEPLPLDAAARITQLARAIRDNTQEPLDVRTAAACAIS